MKIKKYFMKKENEYVKKPLLFVQKYAILILGALVNILIKGALLWTLLICYFFWYYELSRRCFGCLNLQFDRTKDNQMILEKNYPKLNP